MKLLLIPILMLSVYPVFAQSKWEHGIGLGISLTDFKESYNSKEEEIFNLDGQILMTSLQFWNAYNIKEKIKISLSPGFSWKGAKANYSGQVYDGVYFDMPLVMHYQITPNLHLSNGLSYQFLISFGEQSDKEFYNLTNEVENKHLISWSSGVTYSFSDWMDLNFNFNQSFNTVYSLDVKDSNNNDLGKVDLKNKAFQIVAIFKH